MESISGVYDDLNEKMHDVDKTMWVSLYISFTYQHRSVRRRQIPWNGRLHLSIFDFLDWSWFALAAKTTFFSTEWFRTPSQNFQTLWDRGYFFQFTSRNNIYSMTQNSLLCWCNVFKFCRCKTFSDTALVSLATFLWRRWFSQYIISSFDALHFEQLARLTTGPEIRGCRPILVTFNNFKVKNIFLFLFLFNHLFSSLKDREEVLSKAKLLKRSNIYVSEDLSRYFMFACKAFFWHSVLDSVTISLSTLCQFDKQSLNQENSRAQTRAAEVFATGSLLNPDQSGCLLSKEAFVEDTEFPTIIIIPLIACSQLIDLD